MSVHHCDTCDHYVRDADQEPCAIGHKPKWFAPRDEDWATSWDWGWKRDCKDFTRGD